MTNLRVLLHVADQRDYELHLLYFSTAFLQGSLHKEIRLRRPPGFTGSFPADASESAAPSAGESALSGTASAQVFHTFTLDSGASRSFFRDRTTLTPLSRLVAVSLADPSGGRVLARYSTVLPCPAAPSGSLSGLYLPSFSTNLLVSPLPAPSPYAGPTGGLAERHEPESRPVSPVCTARTSRRVPRPLPPTVPGTHHMTLRPSTAPQLVPLPSPPVSSLPALADPASDSLRAASPTVTRLLNTVVTDPSFESTAASALVTELVDFAAHCRLDFATSLVAESASTYPPSVGVECTLSTDVLEDRHEEFQCFAAALPHLVSTLLAPEGDPDAPDIPTPRSYAEAIEGPHSSPWQADMDAEMASWKSTGTYVDEVPPPGANIVSGMWIFRVKWPPGSPPVFKARYVARSFTFLQGSLHEEIWLRRPPGFTGLFPVGTHWSLRRPVYGLRQAPREWQDTLRTTLATLGFAPSTADPSLFLRTDTLLPPFYILVAECTITLTQPHMVQQVLQRFGFTYSSPQSTPLPTGHSLSSPPSNESVEPSGPYSELVGCLMYLMTCTRPNLVYPLSILARYVAPRRHRPEHMAAAKRVLRYLCSTSGLGLVLGGRSPVVLTGHADASWVDDLATQRSSQGYTFSLGSGSVSWWSTRSSSVLSSSCETEIYAGAMAAQELRWFTYLLNDLGLNMTGTDSRGANGKMARAREAGEQGGVACGGVGTHQPANPTLPTSSTPSPTTVDPLKAFSIEKFMGKDYEHWSFRMRLMYTQYNLLDLVEGKEKMPEAAELKGAWMKRSFDAYMLMVQAVGGRQLDHIKDLLGNP
ncbi:unnamed protein product [Closterium sp. NIES-54]